VFVIVRTQEKDFMKEKIEKVAGLEDNNVLEETL